MLNDVELKLCDIQGRLFELSADSGIPSIPFIKAFMRSDIAKALDSKYNRIQWAEEEYLLEEVRDSAGSALLTPGEVLMKDVLYWIGYIYRYWHCLTGENSAKILREAPIAVMKRNYLMFHTMAPELAIENLKEVGA